MRLLAGAIQNGPATLGTTVFVGRLMGERARRPSGCDGSCLRVAGGGGWSCIASTPCRGKQAIRLRLWLDLARGRLNAALEEQRDVHA